MSSDIVKAFILGIVEGVTEFLPISSTGHLILAGKALSFTGESAKVFEIFIQLGAILSVVWLYRTKILSVVSDVGTKDANRFLTNLLIAFIPAAVIGLLTHSFIKKHLFGSFTVALALIIGGVLILIIERVVNPPRGERGGLEVDNITYRQAFGVGLAQVLSLFPGVSRSGATIMGGLIAGLDRKTATEFSFFLAIPTMFAATSYDLLKNFRELSISDLPVFATGFIVSFISALIVIKAFLGFVTKHNFSAFAYYRIIFGILVLLLL
ncbi:MAG: undecaprenyl-diphosphate phosphatase [Nitrospinae bacterium]|nr:undecaprenyl-diphosphate phosphatase [Nitrospinota bacterium]MBI3815770.1 undecaprenyl-diphosphate phosphatase [Nitrospinota bacterium]